MRSDFSNTKRTKRTNTRTPRSRMDDVIYITCKTRCTAVHRQSHEQKRKTTNQPISNPQNPVFNNHGLRPRNHSQNPGVPDLKKIASSATASSTVTSTEVVQYSTRSTRMRSDFYIFSLSVENDQADAGRDYRTRIARPNFQVRMGTGKYLFSLFSHELDWQPYPVDPYGLPVL